MDFLQLTAKLSPTLKRITYRLNGHFSAFNHEDLYQEALVHLWQDFKAGKLQDKTDSYILQGCYFHLKNYLRKIKAGVNLVSLDEVKEETETDLEDILAADEPLEYFEYLDSKFLVEKMRNNGLGSKEKQVLQYLLDGLTIREIGSRMGMSHVGVLKLKDKIRQRYQNIFTELA